MNFDIMTAPKRNSLHWEQGTITWDEILAWMEVPANKKESGSYILGKLRPSTVTHRGSETPCRNLHRLKAAVDLRGALTLDVDHPGEDFAEKVELLLSYAAVLHTTYSSTPEEPRYRLIIPLDRTVAPDEYHTAASAVIQLLGEENFDPGSVQPERYMFSPSESKPGYFSHTVLDGPPASVAKLLKSFKRDLSTLPAPKLSRNKRDPFAIEGTIGAFNRSYEDWQSLIDTYDLPYTALGDDRWQLQGASAAAGMGPVQGQPGLVFSHHANDPAYGVACSAFDLARLHLFGDLDEDVKPDTPINKRPSNRAMLEKATEDVRVVQELVGQDFAEEMDGVAEAVTTGSWWLGFKLDPRTGQPEDDIRNWDLITQNDPAFQALFYNELTLATEITTALPWRPLAPGRESFDGKDRAALALYIERKYKIRPSRAYLDDLIAEQITGRRVNPIRDYLQGLVWDGTPRVEECLPGVETTDFTRMVARKALTAAVARMLNPGCKWDHMVVVYGPEGLGKSSWIEKMFRGFDAELGRIGDKETLLTMQRSWVMIADEGNNMKKADFDAQKAFITRTSDVFRMPYDREAQVHQRHCVIWGTTNDEVFLRRQEGNRRFLIVRSESEVDFDALTDQYVDQVWAEAVHLYRSGEKLWLDSDDSEMAAAEREEFTEEDALTGQIQSYLDTLVPDDWDTTSPEGRQLWLQQAADNFVKGTQPITEVCSLQVWVEAMGRRKGDHRRIDLLDITNALKNIKGWKLQPGNVRTAAYGPQKVFIRDEDDLL